MANYRVIICIARDSITFEPSNYWDSVTVETSIHSLWKISVFVSTVTFTLSQIRKCWFIKCLGLYRFLYPIFFLFRKNIFPFLTLEGGPAPLLVMLPQISLLELVSLSQTSFHELRCAHSRHDDDPYPEFLSLAMFSIYYRVSLYLWWCLECLRCLRLTDGCPLPPGPLCPGLSASIQGKLDNSAHFIEVI